MKRLLQTERVGRAEKLEAQGLSFHSWDDYWNEGVAYSFTLAEVNEIERVTKELHGMCLEAVDHVIKQDRLSQLQIPEHHHDLVCESWFLKEKSLYGRFDLAFNNGKITMLEYNADTPTSLLESAVCQWYWMEDVHPGKDQFNSIHDKLVERWKQVALDKTIHFASIKDNEEDWVCVHYLMETAIQAGLNVEHIAVEDLGVAGGEFYDMYNNRISSLFKLYPWESLLREDFAKYLRQSHTHFIEPVWKAVLSNKAILPILWEMFPGHPNLAPAYLDGPREMKDYAKKPIFSREGANVQLICDGQIIAEDDGPYGEEGHVYQGLIELPCFDGNYPVIGSWVVGDDPAGMDIREDSLRITTNLSHFIPHFIEG